MTFTSTEQQDWEDRVVLICKPEQSGKTFIMIQQIIRDLEEPTKGKTVINFIFCNNNLLQTKQTSARVQTELTSHKEEVYGEVEGETICKDESSGEEDESSEEDKNFYVEFSTGKGAKRDIPDIWMAITGPEQIKNIVCCTNKKRVSDISRLIRKFNRTPNYQDKFIFHIWLDEADKFTNFIGNSFRPLLHKNDNVHLYFLTATPNDLFKKYENLNVFPLECTTSPNYHGWQDNHKMILENTNGDPVGFIHDVLTKVVSPRRGSKWYIPACTTKSSHELVRDILLGKCFAVFVVNGDGLALSVPGEERVCEKKTEELNKQIMGLYKKNNLDRFPVAVTGNICVGRGISIMSPEFIFDYGILSNCAKKAEASQNAGRLKGNMKDWPNYKPPAVFTTAKFDKVASEWEEKSRRLATLAFEKQQDGERPVISKPEFKGICDGCGEPEIVKFYGEDGQIRVKKFFEENLQSKFGGKGPNKTTKNKDGFYIRPIGKGPDRKDVCSTEKMLHHCKWNLSRNSKTRRTKYTLFPCYSDVSDPNTVEWWLIYYN